MNIPKYINDKTNIIRLVVVTAVFALVFINIYKPFDSNSWYPVSEFMFFVYSSLIILTGVLVVIISRIIMYYYSRNHEISYLKYFIWVIIEILAMSLFYTIYSVVIKYRKGELVNSMDVFKDSTLNTALVVLLPYIALWLYFGWQESTKRLKKIEDGDEPDLLNPLKSITFKDEKGALRLSLLLEDLLYIESADNYVVIHYTSNGKIRTYLLRNSLKNLEFSLRKSPIARCHRSYLVNFDRVKVIRRTKDGLMLEIDEPATPDIPVSKSYQEEVSRKFLGKGE